MRESSAVFNKASGIKECKSKLQRPPESRNRVEVLFIDFVPWIVGEMIDFNAAIGRKWIQHTRDIRIVLTVKVRVGQIPVAVRIDLWNPSLLGIVPALNLEFANALAQ